jgi:hypothetical protein
MAPKRAAEEAAAAADAKKPHLTKDEQEVRAHFKAYLSKINDILFDHFFNLIFVSFPRHLSLRLTSTTKLMRRLIAWESL